MYRVLWSEEEKKAAKARTAEEKAAAKQKREAEREKQAEETRKKEGVSALDQQTQSVQPDRSASPVENPVISPSAEEHERRERQDDDSLYREPTQTAQTAQTAGAEQRSRPSSPSSPASPTSPKRIKAFLNKFKRRSKHSAATAETDKPGFIGGAALRQSSNQSERASNPPSPRPQPVQDTEPTRRYSDVSSLSHYSTAEGDRGRDPRAKPQDVESPTRDSVEIEETRDSFDEKLAPPPAFPSSDADAGRKGSPSRDSRFHEVGL
ncbi:hypothetical protein M011DRAFT_304207 [Sporormia fimetaria CBS 119925]|uniref:Uncharacterized protein n=1 Tax=Sporormia fimetaria CBS 119925 TaxID=1340428 RepID=A0A6A6VHQ2_9PLEO|nr:hypothetical protein M011DRAFT_304207 [Sporormia fimetaria CBS 119925]